MKRIIFVKNLETEEDVLKIEEALSHTLLDYSVSLPSKAVIVHGDNDALYTAKQAIAQAGYTIM